MQEDVVYRGKRNHFEKRRGQRWVPFIESLYLFVYLSDGKCVVGDPAGKLEKLRVHSFFQRVFSEGKTQPDVAELTTEGEQMFKSRRYLKVFFCSDD